MTMHPIEEIKFLTEISNDQKAEIERLRAALGKAKSAMIHVRGQMLHPDQLLDEAIDATIKETSDEL
jgi:hypothetical protein